MKTRAKLSEHQVLEIFQLKKGMSTHSAAQVARQFKVSEKAVRDIWTGRTWSSETWPLDTTRVLEHKRIGRPKGRRDSKPRQHRIRREDSEREDSEAIQQTSQSNDADAADQTTSWDSALARSATSKSAPTVGIEEDRMETLSDGCAAPCPLSKNTLLTVPSSSGESVDQQLFEWELASRAPATRFADRTSFKVGAS